jgi:SAM-dependent methyltransferase
MEIFYRRQYDLHAPRARYPLKLGYLSSHTVVLDAVPPGGRILDLGCGRGLVGRELEKRGCTVVGVDRDPFGDGCLLADFQRLDLAEEPLPLDPAAFDQVLLMDVLEHLDTHQQFRLLDDLRARSTGGRPEYLITTPNVAFLLVRLQLLLGRFNYGRRGILDHTHRRLFTLAAVRDLLGQSGFRILQVRGIPPPIPAALGDHFWSRFLLLLWRGLIALLPRLFSYQFFLRVRPLPTVTELLARAGGGAAVSGEVPFQPPGPRSGAGPPPGP